MNTKSPISTLGKRGLLLCIVLLITSFTDQGHPQLIPIGGKERPQFAPPGGEQKGYVPGEILIRFKDGIGKQVIETIQGELHLQTIREFSIPNLYLMKILDGSPVETIIERLRNYEEVQYSEPNYVRTIY